LFQLDKWISAFAGMAVCGWDSIEDALGALFSARVVYRLPRIW
jgi:hypothetical protein